MAQQININEVMGQMTNMMVQVMPIKMIMSTMAMSMGGGMMAKTEQPRKKYWWAIVYSFGEGVNYSALPYGPASSAQKATGLVTVSLTKSQSIFVTSTDSPLKGAALDKFEKSFIRPEYRKGTTKQDESTRSTVETRDVEKAHEIFLRAQKVVSKADDAFWAEVAKAFPEVKTGDFPPDATSIFDDCEKKSIAVWLLYNHPVLQRMNNLDELEISNWP